MKSVFGNLLKTACLSAVIASGILVTPSMANDKKQAIDAISNHFKSVPTMTGDNQTSWQDQIQL